MKKRIVSLIVLTFLVASVALGAAATSNFDISVFQNVDDIQMQYDAMTGEASIYNKSLFVDGKGVIAVNDRVAEVLPMVSSDESVDAFMLNLNYYGYSWMNINEIVFKIGDNRYFFTSDQGPINVRQESYSNGIVKEQLLIVLDANSISFMQDFIEHRDEEILVRFSGADSVMDFALTQEIKDATIGLYDRYVMAGGTQPESLQTVTDLHCIKMQVLNREV